MSEFKEISTKNLQKSIERLTKLADYLRDNVPNQRFDLDTFVNHEKDIFGRKEDLKTVRKELKEGFCGTTACAVGHACMMPEFQKKGMRVRIVDSSGWGSSEGNYLAATFKDKDGNIFEGFEAAQKFFKISEDRAEKLFSPDGYNHGGWGPSNVSKSQVVKAIRDYVYRAKKHLAKREVVEV